MVTLDPGCGCCECCEAAVDPTPEWVTNRPGLSAIRYRVGTWATFYQAMVEGIARAPELRQRFTSRDSDDAGIALLDLWATVGDILTFYSERIANEAFLRTATQRDSVFRLAALLDYEPAPGKAAAADLVLTLDAGRALTVPAGTRVQSVPGPGEKPQKFETSAELAADARLNSLRVWPEPVAAGPAPLGPGSASGLLDPAAADRIAATVVPDDKLVILRAIHPRVIETTVAEITTADGFTRLSWATPLPTTVSTITLTSEPDRMWRFGRKFRLFGRDAPTTYPAYVTNPDGDHTSDPPQPDLIWTIATTSFNLGTTTTLALDGTYDNLPPGVSVLVQHSGGVGTATITGVSEAERTVGPLTATVTVLTLSAGFTISNLRAVVVHELVGPEITFWPRDFAAATAGDTVYVVETDLRGDALKPGRKLILDDVTGDPQPVVIEQITPLTADGVAFLAVRVSPTPRGLDAATARLFGNVVEATHGETVAGEVLGDGNAALAFQRFGLRKHPVTRVADALAEHGAASTLEVRVDSIRWTEVDTLYGQRSDAEVYETLVAADGAVTAVFGDGRMGARLPTGRQNVVATYRQGMGADGNVAAGSLTNLLDKPVGLKASTNPADAAGGAEPERTDEARANAPNTVRTFDRVVSLRDFEDAARGYSGVAKARAVWQWDGEDPVVQLTVAGDDGHVLTTDELADLTAYLDARRDRNRFLTVRPHVDAPLVVTVGVEREANHDAEVVKQAVVAALLSHFAFDHQTLGRAVHWSDVLAAIQAVPGVVGADLDALHRKGVPTATVPVHLPLEAHELAMIEAEADVQVTLRGLLP